MALHRVGMAGEKRVAWKKASGEATCVSGHNVFDTWDGASADDELVVACGSSVYEILFTVAAS